MRLPEVYPILFKLFLPQVLAAVFFMGFSYFTFHWPVDFIFDHAAVWTLGMGVGSILTAVTFALAQLAGFPQPRRWAALVPACVFSFLWLAYVSSVVGNASWGVTPSLALLRQYVPEFFTLVASFSLPLPLALAVIFLPPLAVFFFYQRQSGDLERLARGDKKSKGKNFLASKGWLLFFAGWAGGFLACLALQNVSDILSLFVHDPVVQLFYKGQANVPLTLRQLSASREDIAARIAVTRQLSGAAGPSHRNLFLFVVDATRSDHLPEYGYGRPITPFLSAFIPSQGGRIIPMALSNGTETGAGMPALFLSKNFPEISANNYSLGDFLKDWGFQINVFMSGDHRGLIDNHSYGQISEDMQDGTTNRNKALYDIDDDAGLLELVQALPPDDGSRHFIYFHLMSVHQSGTLNAAFKRYLPTYNMSQFPWQKFGPAQIPGVINLYDDRILQADDYLRRIIDVLRQKGYLSDYRAMITADHGQMLGEHGVFGHVTPYVFFDNLHIPIILFGSEPIPRLPNSFGLEIDVAPTLVDLLGLKPPSSWRGKSLLQKQGDRWGLHFSPRADPDQEVVVTYWHQGTLWKYTRKRNIPLSAADERLNNLTQDPGEKKNLIGSCGPAFVDLFRGYLASQMNPSGSPRSGS
jgi:hypothetical protein